MWKYKRKCLKVMWGREKGLHHIVQFELRIPVNILQSWSVLHREPLVYLFLPPQMEEITTLQHAFGPRPKALITTDPHIYWKYFPMFPASPSSIRHIHWVHLGAKHHETYSRTEFYFIKNNNPKHTVDSFFSEIFLIGFFSLFPGEWLELVQEKRVNTQRINDGGCVSSEACTRIKIFWQLHDSAFHRTKF